VLALLIMKEKVLEHQTPPPFKHYMQPELAILRTGDASTAATVFFAYVGAEKVHKSVL
jgi:hypothetical protein